MTDHCDQRDGDAWSDCDSVSLMPDNTRLNVEKVEEISAKNKKGRKKKRNTNQLKPSDPGNGSCTQFSTGCAESSSQSASKTPRLPRNLKKRNGKGEIVLHTACKTKNLAKVKALIQADIDVNTEDYSGWTALHVACVSGNVAMVKELLNAGANVHARNLDGGTPLHGAVDCGHYEVVKCLLQCGSNSNDKNVGGLSALDMAKEETIKELLSAFQPPAEICESHCDKSSNYQSSIPPNTSDTANVRSRESGDRDRAREPDDIHWRKKDTITDNLCGSKDFAVVLGKVDTNQTELSFWPPLGAENAGRYYTVLIQTHNLLADVLTKQYLEKDYLTQNCQSVFSSLCQCLLRSQLNSLTSRQRDLVRLLQRQMELAEAYVTMKTTWLTQPTSQQQPNRCANPRSRPVFSTGRRSYSCNRDNHRKQSHTPVTQTGLKGRRGLRTPVTLPTQTNRAPIQTDVLKKRDSRPLQDAPQPTNMDLLHLCSVRRDELIRDCKGKLHQAPEPCVESVLGNNNSVSSSYVWNKVTLEDQPLSHYLLNTETEENSAQAHSVEELHQYNTSSAQTPVADSLNCLMKIETIHLVHDDEVLPNATMDVYWEKLLRKDCENWGFE